MNIDMNIEILLEENEIIHQAANAVLNFAEPLRYIDEERVMVTRNKNYYEETIPQYTDLQFREHFRMCRVTFEQLCICISQVRENDTDRTVPLEKKVLFTVWMLSKPESFLAAGDRFGLAKSSSYKIFCEMLQVICQLTPQFIKWPNAHRNIQTANIFEARSRGIPGVVGAIDGCHIPIKQPEGNAIDYYNRKGFHSIVLQGICDENGIFIDTNIGRPGRMHDARVFRLSQIYAHLSGPHPILPHNMHLIGDSAYPLMLNLLKPYQDNGHLSPQQVNFNTKLSSIRSIIERAFGLLKCKFRRLKFLDVQNAQMANRIILAACVLHNFILIHGNGQDDYDIEAFNEIENANEGGNNEVDDNEAEIKRSNIARSCYRR